MGSTTCRVETGRQSSGNLFIILQAVASLGVGGPLRVTPSRRVTPDLKLILWLNLERTLDKRRVKIGKKGSGEDTTAKKGKIKVITFRGNEKR